MQNQKLENIFQLALSATPQELEKSLELEEGFDAGERTWEVVIKYSGDAEEFQEILRSRFSSYYSQIQMVNLKNEYMILVLPESIVEQVANQPEIEFMEKPKSLFFAVDQGKSASCVNALQTGATPDTALTGKNVLVAVIDSGIDYAHPDFRNDDGTTRILFLWDQTIPSGSVRNVAAVEEGGQSAQTEEWRNGDVLHEEYLSAPQGYYLGTEFDQSIINAALDQPMEPLRYTICPSRDTSGHGTHVAGIAAGNGRASNGKYRGIAYESGLLVVKLGTPQAGGFPRTTELMQAVDYCVKKAEALGSPMVINLSFGNNYGSHSGTSLLETYLNDMANYGRISIVTGSGNEGASSAHTSGTVQQGRMEQIELAVSEFETSFNLQIWKSYVDEMLVSVLTPDGRELGPISEAGGPLRYRTGRTQLLIYYGKPSPYSPYQEIFFDFIPTEEYVDGGVWEIRLTPQRIVQGNYDMWLPGGGVINVGTRFLYPTENTTLTIPSTAAKVITVGAYDSRYSQPAAFSGRGFTRETDQKKPDLVAPGVDINSCAPGGGYTVRTGTSMAAPFVSGSVALMMEWGIINGNDLYLYGEKAKAYLQRGAKQLPGFTEWPNRRLGYGTLCLKASIPEE